MRRVGSRRVNGGYDRMPGQGGLDRRIRFGVSHLADDHDVRIETEGRHDEIFLCDVVSRVVRRARKRMNDVVHDLSFFRADKRQLTGTAFNRKDTLVVRDRGEKRVEQSGFT